MAASAESVPALRRFAGAMAQRWNLHESMDEALALVVTELSSNVVRHSGSPDLALLLTVHGRTLTVQVRDAGRWRQRRPTVPPQGSASPRQPEDGEACDGRGLRLVEAHAASLRVWCSTLGTQVTAKLLPVLPGS
ncbi:ATP-binding protein [Kitasatospora sp. NPDC051914]|uniref:ATP-binding protein n=1 Tax=Kitasatospora sp. NPDC051914 TaxID=3154945 RepID=UPI00343326AD